MCELCDMLAGLLYERARVAWPGADNWTAAQDKYTEKDRQRFVSQEASRLAAKLVAMLDEPDKED